MEDLFLGKRVLVVTDTVHMAGDTLRRVADRAHDQGLPVNVSLSGLWIAQRDLPNLASIRFTTESHQLRGRSADVLYYAGRPDHRTRDLLYPITAYTGGEFIRH